MIQRFRPARAILAAAAMTLGLGPVAQAGPLDAFKSAYQCAKDAGTGSLKVMGDVAKKSALIAEIGANASACTAAGGGTAVPYGVTLAAISAIKAASPETVPTGQCAKSIKGVVARPFGEGISYIMPPGSIRTKLLVVVNSDAAKEQIWSMIESVPGVQPYTVQVGCACTTIDNGIALTDLREVGDAISQVSESCAAMLDTLGLGFINDLDDAAERAAHKAYASLSGAYDEYVNGESDPEPYGVVYDREFSTGRRHFIKRFAQQGPKAEPIVLSELSSRIHSCAMYYDNHKHSYSNGVKICTEMAQRLMADVKAEGLREYNESSMLKQIEASWNSLFETHWAWRLPPVPTGFPANDSAGLAEKLKVFTVGGVTHPDAPQLKSLAGGLDCTGVDTPGVLARCKASGVYAAAMQGWAYAGDAAMAVKVAQTGITPRMSQHIAGRWNANKQHVRDYYLLWWLGDPAPMSGPFGCPANEPLRSACLEDLKASFDTGCFDKMRDAVAYAPSSASIVFGPVAGSMSGCQNLLGTRTDFANKLANYAVDIPPAGAAANICSSYPARSNELLACQKYVTAAYDDCAVKAMKAGYTVSQPGGFKTCWAPAQKDLAEKMPALLAVRSPPAVSGTVVAPDKVPAVNDLPKLPSKPMSTTPPPTTVPRK
ncbi:MAG: hypothetical protein ACK4HR_06370 [Hyphomonas sp.]|jgi:hypothetical protein